MKKSTSRNLYLLALLLDIVGVVLFVIGAVGSNLNDLNTLAASGHLFVSADMSNPMFTAIGALLVALGGLLFLIAWIGALIRTAQLGRWGWFVCLLVLSGITMLVYIFGGPTTSVNQPVGQFPYGQQPMR